MKEITISTWTLRTLALILGVLFHYSVYSSNIPSNEHVADNTVEVKIVGIWEKTRSLLPSTPFTASANSYILYIQNANPNCDITIRTMDDSGLAVFEEAIAKDESSYIVIPIDALQDGYYTLEIRNATGGYVYGSFVKETNDF